MQARIHRGRLRINLQEPDKDMRLHLFGRLAEAIGSLNQVKDSVDVSCALSVENLRKLKRFDCGLRPDELTRATVQRLIEEQKVYAEESDRGERSKVGEVFFDHNYKWPAKYPPFDHQILGFHFLHSMPNPALFGDCGSGKTYIVLTHSESLIDAGQKWCLLVVCPVNLIEHVWMVDSKKFTSLSCVTLRERRPMSLRASDFDLPGDPSDLSRKERAELRASRRDDPEECQRTLTRARARRTRWVSERYEHNASIYAINPENARTRANADRLRNLIRRRKKEGYSMCLVIDESSRIKSHTSATYRVLRTLRRLCERCIIMTGTPSPNGLLDLWSQFHILDDGKTLQPSFADYRHHTCQRFEYKGRTYKDDEGKTRNIEGWNPRPGAALRVYRTISPRMIRFKTEDCLDLPPYRFALREVEMNREQEEAYHAMEERLFLELEGESVTAKVAVTKLMKLREITGGFLITDKKKEIPLGKKGSPKMLELDQLLEQSIGDKMGEEGPSSKALIWAQYKWECRTLVKRYAKRYGAKGLFGGISSSAKDTAIRDFDMDPKRRLLVCHPGSVGHGLNLVAANYAFYYSLSYNYEEFYQSFRRTMRQGQLRAMIYYFLVCPDTIDWELLDTLTSKQNLSDLVTDGEFNRNALLKRRQRTDVANLQLEWEVPDVANPEASLR
jgi:hypothetical protein